MSEPVIAVLVLRGSKKEQAITILKLFGKSLNQSICGNLEELSLLKRSIFLGKVLTDCGKCQELLE